MKLAQLAELAQAELAGSGDVEIQAVTDLDRAHTGALVMVADARRLPEAEASPAGALLVASQAPATSKPTLRARNLRAAFARVLAALAPPLRWAEGAHPTAVVAPDAALGPAVTLGPCAVVDAGAVIGARSAILAGATVGAGVRIGTDCIVHPNVTIYPGSILGDRVTIHSGAVIGSDGFGYATEDGVHLKIAHLGRVVIEDDVEIGANTTVDRGTLGETRIGRGTKIDNLVQVAHNVTIGERVIIVAFVGVAGSVTIGDGALLAGQSGVGDHLAVGAGARVMGRAGVTKDVRTGATVSGFPARDHREELKVQAALRYLPDLLHRIQALEARLDKQPPRRSARSRRP
ncbi:MAG: UDP-3-O-(3-hydroxymyristoyl)glucosamine N-acyltransferase [Armatimonadota bacterium]